MNTTIERTLTGTFRIEHLAAGAWQLTTDAKADAPAEIYLCGVERDAFGALESATPSAVRVAWSDAGAVVTLISRGSSTQLRSRTALIHEPRPRLYDGLPLVVLDAKARRFWQRVFWIARLPGGRALLRWIARRSGGD